MATSNKTKKIMYITTPEWWDTDVSLIPTIVKNNDVELHIIVLLSSVVLKYTYSDIKKFCDDQGLFFTALQRTHKIRHISNFFIALKVLHAIKKAKSPVIVYLYCIDLYLNTLFIFLRKKMIVSFHNYIEHKGTNKASSENIYKKVFIRFYRYFHFHSDYQRKLFLKDFPEKKSFFTTMPLKDYGVFTGTPVKTDKKELLFFGYIREYKNLAMLIRSVEEVDGLAIRLTIAGKCDDFSEYDKLISRDELFNRQIRFIKNEEVPYFFSNADYIVLPYADSTQSGPMLIAMNYTVPIIASDIPPFNAIIKNKINGFLFDVKNPGSLTRVLYDAGNLTDHDYRIIKDNFSKTVTAYQEKVMLNHSSFRSFLDTITTDNKNRFTLKM